MKKLSPGQENFLDVFRIVAALFVLIGHSFSFYGLTFLKNQQYFPCIQNMGVVMLFLLSGFLLMKSLSGKPKEYFSSFGPFCWHRMIRLGKEYLPGLLMIVVIDGIAILVNENKYSYSAAYTVQNFLGNLFMFHETILSSICSKFIGIGHIIPFGSGRPLWTLSIEWWMYLLFGYFFFLWQRRKITAMNFFVLAILFLIPIRSLIGGRGNGLGLVFLLGMVLWVVLFKFEWSLKFKYLSFAMLLLLYIVYGCVFKEAYTWLSFVLVGCIMFSGLLMSGGGGRQKRYNILSRIAQSTFMLYLIHYSIIDFLVHWDCGLGVLVKFWLGIVISIILAIALYYGFGYRNLIGKSFGFRF